MRLLLSTMTLLIFISCNDNSKDSVSQKVQHDLLKEQDKIHNLKNPNKPTDSLDNEIVNVGTEEQQIAQIRDKVNSISDRKEWTKLANRKFDLNHVKSSTDYYFVGENLKLVHFEENTDSTHRSVDFYLEDKELLLVFERQSDPIGLKSDTEPNEVAEDSLFFEKGKVIRIKSNLDCGAPFAEEYRNRAQSEFQTELNRIIARLNE